MKKYTLTLLLLFLLLFINLAGCSSDSGDSADSSNDPIISTPDLGSASVKGVVRISGNAFFDFDLQSVSNNINNSYDKAQLIQTNSHTAGYVESRTDQFDWFLLKAYESGTVSFTSGADIFAYIGTSENSMNSFDSYNISAGSSYYIKIDAGVSKGNYLITIKNSRTVNVNRNADFVPGEIIVSFNKNQRTALSSNDLDLDLKKENNNFNVYSIKSRRALSYSSLKQETLDTIDKLNNMSAVEYAEPNYIRKVCYTPNDELYPQLWNLEQINVPYAWNIERGKGAVIAILDSGIKDHNDLLSKRVIKGFDFIDNDTNPEDSGIITSDSHGVHVAGIAAAEADNSIGIAGVAPESKVMIVRIVDQDITSEDIAEGIRYASGIENASKYLPAVAADVINMSFGGEPFSYTEKKAVDEAVAKGIILVSSSGNEGNDAVYYPASYDNVFSVAAVNSFGSRASYSNFGPHISIAAPGGESKGIISLSSHDESAYVPMVGTSMATPHVAGVFALMKARDKRITSADLYSMLYSGKLTFPNDGNGFSEYTGYGIIDADACISSVTEFSPYENIKAVLKDSDGNTVKVVFAKKALAGDFVYSFYDLEKGIYSLEVGIDLNGDNDFTDTGETFSSFDFEYLVNSLELNDAYLSY